MEMQTKTYSERANTMIEGKPSIQLIVAADMACSRLKRMLLDNPEAMEAVCNLGA
jgi:hypothetical protein